jgi:hypothetical protein
MPKKKITEEKLDEFLSEEEFEKVIGEEDVLPKKVEKKLKEHIVLAWNSGKVYYKLASGHVCFTQNIWGTKLVPGDTIYLEE